MTLYWLFKKFCCACLPENQNYFEVLQSFFELQNISDPAEMRSQHLDRCSGELGLQGIKTRHSYYPSELRLY